MEKRWKVGIISDAAGFSQAGSIFIDEPSDDLEEVKKISPVICQPDM